MSYLDLITSHLEGSGASPELVTVVAECLEHGDPAEDPPWDCDLDEIVERAVRFANSKRFRLRRFKAALNARHAASLEQEAGAVRRALKHGNSTKKARQTMISRLELLECQIKTSKTDAK